MEIIFLVRNLKNKKNDFLKILITGAGSGLGKQVAIVLASMGYEIFAGIKFDEEIEDFKKIIILKKLKIHVFKMDILEKNDRNFISDFAIDILICNAAIGNSGLIIESGIICYDYTTLFIFLLFIKIFFYFMVFTAFSAKLLFTTLL